MQNYDFNFLDLRNDKIPFFSSLCDFIKKELPDNAGYLAIKRIDLGLVDSVFNNSSTNSTSITVFFRYTLTNKVVQKVPKSFLDWVLFRKQKYEDVCTKEEKEGRLVLSYNDYSVSDKWKPSNTKVYV